MKFILLIVAVLLILSGGVFFLQGLRFLPSPLMYGKSEWVYIGGAMMIIGVGLIAFAYRQVIGKLFRSR
jgi:hypothetical protein